MRLALGQRVATNQHRAALLPAQLRQDQARQIFGLVGDDAPDAAGILQPHQHLLDTIKQLRLRTNQALVALQEFRHQRNARHGIELGKGHAEHRTRTFGDHRTQRSQRNWRTPTRIQHGVNGREHVRRAVQQGAIQIEQHRTRETHSITCRQLRSARHATEIIKTPTNGRCESQIPNFEPRLLTVSPHTPGNSPRYAKTGGRDYATARTACR